MNCKVQDIAIDVINPSEGSINFIFSIFLDPFYTKNFPDTIYFTLPALWANPRLT